MSSWPPPLCHSILHSTVPLPYPYHTHTMPYSYHTMPVWVWYRRLWRCSKYRTPSPNAYGHAHHAHVLSCRQLAMHTYSRVDSWPCTRTLVSTVDMWTPPTPVPGRCEEMMGEDPHLAAKLGRAVIEACLPLRCYVGIPFFARVRALACFLCVMLLLHAFTRAVIAACSHLRCHLVSCLVGWGMFLYANKGLKGHSYTPGCVFFHPRRTVAHGCGM